jgi:hypothetical protein
MDMSTITVTLPAFQIAPLMRESDETAEVVREDVAHALGAAYTYLNSDIVTVRLLAETGKLDDRCTSAPVLVGAL